MVLVLSICIRCARWLQRQAQKFGIDVVGLRPAVDDENVMKCLLLSTDSGLALCLSSGPPRKLLAGACEVSLIAPPCRLWTMIRGAKGNGGRLITATGCVAQKVIIRLLLEVMMC